MRRVAVEFDALLAGKAEATVERDGVLHQAQIDLNAQK
jgi:hypothetical protein